ncbi:M24 family metallopeptidase [Chondrinema litorale]|uniref:M24 family metallopeptidase n=1 Tax=Chondrinema litorale TaxID=2994555 RepID=UPI002543F239|nr:Xaa-Pro peptidase family protein [Chondrinema litorale]UZR98820.1 Xaa-Pro peptidase family protein [Chondrinema litorale]
MDQLFIKSRATILTWLFLSVSMLSAIAQDKHHYQSDFSIEDFAVRRTTIFEAIGNKAIAVIQGASGVSGFSIFRQSNTFYYLTGLETDHAYLLLNGRNRQTTLYLPHRDEGREKGQGKILSAEDGDLVKQLTGVDRVRAIEFLSSDLISTGLIRPPAPLLYTPLSPAETGNDSRDELLYGQARASSDPWDGQETREALFVQKLKERVPQFEIHDLSPILDSMRLIKSPAEIKLIRQATKIAGEGIIEAMRSTKPGVYEYQLDAAAKYIFHLNGARGDGYASIIGGGTNAFMGHYFHKTDVLNDGDLVLMDYAPDYKYYTSDVTRIWPVNGKFDKAQTALYNYIVAYRDALFKYIKPGVTSNEVLDKAAADMEKYLVGKNFGNAAYLKAVQEGLKFRGHFQHPVGMAVHDVGQVRGVKLKPGMVFTIDPMIWIPEERLYVRIEDVVVVTETGAENLSAFVPSLLKDVEQTIQETGLTEYRKPISQESEK